MSGDNEEAGADLFPHSSHILFGFDDTIVVSRLIEGWYFRNQPDAFSDYETKGICGEQEGIPWTVLSGPPY